MGTKPPSLHLPPRLKKEDGEIRRIGIELELIGLKIDTLSSIVARHLDGAVEKRSAYEHVITGDPRGEWVVELDFAFLKEKGRNPKEPGSLIGELDNLAEELLRAGAEQVVPFEIVSPPLRMIELGEVEELIRRLREAGAQGTNAALAYAFGMQFNPELPRLDARTIISYLKAFFCLFDWLKSRAQVDWTRRLTVYTDPFPKHYVRKVVDTDYWPDMQTLIDDYLYANPTRNRALDMLPMLMCLDERRVKDVVDDPRVKARPTLHYRLPNCEVDDPSWGLYRAWDDWLQVEHITADEHRLEQICRKYSKHLGRPLAGLFRTWEKKVAPWLIATSDL